MIRQSAQCLFWNWYKSPLIYTVAILRKIIKMTSALNVCNNTLPHNANHEQPFQSQEEWWNLTEEYRGKWSTTILKLQFIYHCLQQAVNGHYSCGLTQTCWLLQETMWEKYIRLQLKLLVDTIDSSDSQLHAWTILPTC